MRIALVLLILVLAAPKATLAQTPSPAPTTPPVASSAATPAAPPLTLADVVFRLDPGVRSKPPAGAARPDAPADVGAVCLVQAAGRLGNCRVMEERPAGRGMGAWLLDLLSHANVGTSAKDGAATAGRLFAFRTEVRAGAPPAGASPKS